jgi:hypothetical protein
MNSGSSDFAPRNDRGANERSWSTEDARAAAPTQAGRDRGPVPFPSDDLAARFFAKLGVLARFGLAAHTRLLLEAPREEG